MPIQPSKMNWSRLLFVAAGMAFIFAGVSELDGRSKEQRFQTESGWPTVDARIQACFVSAYHRQQSGSYRFYVYCSYAYTVNGVAFKGSTQTPSSFSNDVVAKMNLWVKQHPKGQMQTIHYNPADPARVSLAGADRELRVYTSAEWAYRTARMMAMIGLGMLIASVILGKMKEWTASDPDTNVGTITPRPL